MLVRYQTVLVAPSVVQPIGQTSHKQNFINQPKIMTKNLKILIRGANWDSRVWAEEGIHRKLWPRLKPFRNGKNDQIACFFIRQLCFDGNSNCERLY